MGDSKINEFSCYWLPKRHSNPKIPPSSPPLHTQTPSSVQQSRRAPPLLLSTSPPLPLFLPPALSRLVEASDLLLLLFLLPLCRLSSPLLSQCTQPLQIGSGTRAHLHPTRGAISRRTRRWCWWETGTSCCCCKRIGNKKKIKLINIYFLNLIILILSFFLSHLQPWLTLNGSMKRTFSGIGTVEL